MKLVVTRLVLAIGLVSLAGAPAYAQGGSSKSSLSGLVVDSAGGVIPGASVEVKNAASGVALNVVTNDTGAFSVPALDPGTYTVTVSLSGFKTAVVRDVTVVAASPTNLNRVVLAIGSVSETVEVKGGAALVNTQTPTISATLSTDQISNLPAQTRNALYAVTLLPGVDTTYGGGQTARNSTVSGLPQYTINITLDGVNVNNNQDRAGDGFYSMVRPNLDAIEEVTVTAATQGADSAGQGAVQVRFVTKSGSNQYKGTLYEYHRDPGLNTNYYFNKVNGLPKNHIVVNQFGGSEGGPIVIPHVVDGRGKAFFFFNYEEFRQPTSATRTRTIFNPLTQAGLFQYSTTVNGATVVQQVDLLKVAAANGQIATPDATVARVLAQIRAAAQTTGVITQNSDPNTMQYIYQSPGDGIEHLPTTRVDFNLSPKQRLTGSYYWQQVNRFPDIQNSYDSNFPGSPLTSNYLSYRTSGSASLRSTLTQNLVNNLQTGWQWSPGIFGAGESKSMYDSQGGYELVFFTGNNPYITSLTPNSLNNVEDPRNTPNWNIDDTVTWLHGRHNVSFGLSFTQVRYIDASGETVPGINFGVQSSLDPADAMFTTANFPNASSANLTNARNVYALLTGRVTSINGTARLDDKTNTYVYLGAGTHHLKLNEYGSFVQDSWRASPTLTLNAGVRWEVQLPVVPLNSNYATATFADLCGISGIGSGPGGRGCNLFKPNTLTGLHPQYVQYTAGSPGYNTEWHNFAPNVGVAWRPNATGGLLRAILGDPDQATIRGGYSVAYNRNGMAEFTNIFGNNPGRTTSGTRNNNNGNLVLPGESWPVLLSQTTRLGPPPACPTGTVAAGCIPATESFPIAATTSNSLNIFDPNIKLSFARSYSLGIQRAVSNDMAIEVRYVGTRNINGWTTENWNETNVLENGFFSEFKLAQANLQSNIAAGRGNTFAYFGAGTGTSPLPTYLAYFNGMPASQAGDPSKYVTGANATNPWTNTTFSGRLGTYQPSVGGAAGDLNGSATFRANALAAGLPVNFFQMNPEVSSANIRTNGPFSKYDSLQIDVRRRLSRGLLFAVNYTYAVRKTSSLDTLHRDRVLIQDTSGVPHALKLQANYDLPFGRGKKFGADLDRWVDAIAGNWLFSLTGRVQSGAVLTASGIQVVGMTQQDLQRAFKIRRDATTGNIYMLPQDIIDNTVKAFSTSATSANGYGALGPPTGRYLAPASRPGCVDLYPTDCGEPRLVSVTGPAFTRIDVSLKKLIKIGKVRMDIEYDALNLFNAINFRPVFTTSTNPDNYRVTNAYTDVSQTFDPGGRLGQIVWKISW